MKTTNLEFFIPDEYLLQLIKFFIRAVPTIIVASSVFYLLYWLCSALVLFINSFTEVCHTLYASLGSSPYLEIAAFVFLMMLNVKVAHIFLKEVRRER